MILVTGGTGMLGSHLLFDLLSKGYKIRASKRKSSNIEDVEKVFSFYTKKHKELFDKIEWYNADMLDYDSVYEAVNGVEIVYHTAATISFNPALKNKIINDNVTGTQNIVNACLYSGVKKLCHVSSIAALGSNTNQGLVDEKSDENIDENSAYNVSKFKSELEVWRGIAEGLNAVIVNPSIILGISNRENGSAKLIKTVLNGLKFYTKGSSGFVDVRDVSKIMIALTESNISSERYILNSENLSYRTVFDEIAKNLNKPQPNIYARNFILQIVRFLEFINFKLFGKEPNITKDTISAASSNIAYSNEKIIKTLNYKFIDIKTSISDICNITLSEMNKN